MRKIIDGRVFNTQTARLVGEWDNGHYTNDFSYCSEALYKSKGGLYFLHGQGGAMSRYAKQSGNTRGGGERIVPLDDAEAEQWAEQHLEAAEYEAEFGTVPEKGEPRERVSWTLDAELVSHLRDKSTASGVPVSRLVDEALRVAGYGKVADLGRASNEPAAALAEKIRASQTWSLGDLAQLCALAGLSAEWDAADGETFEGVAFKAAAKLGVEIV